MPFSLPDGGPVRVRTSNTASETPTPAELEEGEVALNAADGVLYFQGTSGAVGPVGFQDAPEDEIVYGRKDGEWVDITAPANLQVRRGTASEVAAITPLEGEPVWATDTKRLVLGDGSTLGGVSIGLGGIVAYDTDTRELGVDDEDTSDPNMVLVLPSAGAYYVKMSYKFATAGQVSDLAIYLPSGASVSYVQGVSADDLDGDNRIPIESSSAYDWAREFVCVTTVANVTISPEWFPESDAIDRLPSYSFAIPFA
jgi:hypothetical protein